MLLAAIFVVFPFCMAFSAVSDLLSMTIANRVSVILVVVFAVVAPLTGMAWNDYAMHFAAMAAVLCVTFALFAAGGMGGGDAKLMAATALWMGFGYTLLEYLLYSAFYGGLLTILIVFFRNSPISSLAVNNVLLRNLADRNTGVPYGIALGLGGLMAFPHSALMVWALQQFAQG